MGKAKISSFAVKALKDIQTDFEKRLDTASFLLALALKRNAPRQPEGTTHKRRFLREGIKRTLKRNFNGDPRVQITAPFPALQVEYGHLSPNGKFTPPHPWFWRTVDDMIPTIQAVMEGKGGIDVGIDNGSSVQQETSL